MHEIYRKFQNVTVKFRMESYYISHYSENICRHRHKHRKFLEQYHTIRAIIVLIIYIDIHIDI